jgi:hypothetical protein
VFQTLDSVVDECHNRPEFQVVYVIPQILHLETREGYRMSLALRFLGVAALLLAANSSLWPQSFTAGIRGVVTDESAAAIPGATVTVTDVNRNVKSTATTDELGRYVVTALPPGQYSLTVEAAGFNRFTRTAFDLQVQQQATIDVQMRVGDVATSVEVAGTAPLLNTTIANLGQVVENKYIISTAQHRAQPDELTYLTPGVVGAGGRRGDNSTNFVANGSRNSTSDVLLDGVTVVTVEQNSGITDLKYSPSLTRCRSSRCRRTSSPPNTDRRAAPW